MPPIRVTFMGDDTQLRAATERSEAALSRFAQSSQDAAAKAGRAAAEQAKAAGASADEQVAAAGRAAAAVTEATDRITSAQAAAGRAALSVAKAQGESADMQIAAARRAMAAQAQFEAQTKAMADAQAAAAAKVDLLSGKLSGLGEHATGVAKEISKIGGIGFAASIAGMGDLAAKYQQSTEQIAANSDISSKAAAKIGNAFLGTSGKSIYSAAEMTSAFAAVAGQLKSTEGQALNSAQALTVMNAAGDLAEATNTGLGSATAALSTVMQGYHLRVGQAAAASDMLFNTSRALNQPLDTIAQAINRLHGRLGTLAPSLGDVGGLMVELGSHGVQGSRGVSVVNTAMQTLVGDTQPVQQMLDALGVKIFNAQGKFVGMRDVIAQLQPKMSQLTQQSQDLAAKTLFGSSAAQVMLSIVQRGPEAFNASVAAAQEMGTAHTAAADQSKTLGKQLDILKASVENDATSIGLKLIPALTSMAKGLQDGIGWLERHKLAAEALAVAVGTVLAAAVSVFAYQKAAAFVSGVQEMQGAVKALIAKLVGGGALEGAAKAVGPELALVGTDAELAAGKVDALGAAAATATPEVDALDTALGSGGLLGTVGGLLEKMGPLAVAFAAFQATKATGLFSSSTWGGNGPTNAFPSPKHGETERRYLAQMNGLPSYSGPLTVAGVEKARANAGMPAEKSLIEQLFKQIGEQGHFGHHGFVANPLYAAHGSKGTVDYKAGNFPRPENQFIQTLSHLSKLDPAVIAGWADAEEPPGAAANPANPYNFLNIGESGSTYRGTATGIWRNPTTAAEATYQWIKSGKGVPGWGASGVPGIIAAGGGSIASQIAAIQDSGWVNGKPNDPAGNYPNLPADVQAVLGSARGLSGTALAGVTVSPTTSPLANHPTHGNRSLNSSILNIGTGAKQPAGFMATVDRKLATEMQDTAAREQAVGQAQVTLLQAINQQLQEKGAAIVQKMQDVQTRINDRAAELVTAMKDRTQKATDQSAAQVQVMKDRTQKATDQSAAQVQVLKDATQRATDVAAAQVTAMKDHQAVADQYSLMQVQSIKDQTQIITDTSSLQVAAIRDTATIIADALSAQATQITDSAQTNADTLGERGLYGLNLVAQQLRVQADQVKAYWDQQIAVAQHTLAVDQQSADIAEASAQVGVDQVTAVQDQKVLAAQQNVNLVTLKQDANVAAAQQRLDAMTARQDAKVNAAKAHMDQVTAVQDQKVARAQQHLDSVTISQDQKVARAQQHLDSVTIVQDARANAAKLHMDAITVAQDTRILTATERADTVQLSVDTRSLGPAQTAADIVAATGTKAQQTAAQNTLDLATAQGNLQVANAQNALAGVTASANSAIASAQNQYQSTQNAATQAIQSAQDRYQSAQNAATQAIQSATDQYQSAQNRANSAIQVATSNYTNVQDLANLAIQMATSHYTSVQNAANSAIQTATGNYQAVQDAANLAIAQAGESAASVTANWAQQLAQDAANLSGTQGQAGVAESQAGAAVTGAQALASTQFAGSGLNVNIYGADLSSPTALSQEVSWAIRQANIQTV